MPILKGTNAAYSPTTWENKKTPLNASNMNKIEAGIKTATDTSTAAQTTADEAKSLAVNKQDKLTAGTNITIDENNVISAQGGSLDFDDLALYTKYGVFRINGKAYNVKEEGSEIILPVGDTYELSGYLKNGHVFVKSENPENETKCTQLIFNDLYIKSDAPRAIYFNQNKKKVAIKLMANTNNYIYAGEYNYTVEEAEGAIQAEGNLVFTSDKNSYLYIKSAETNEQHAIKASRLYLSGTGLIEVDSAHDGFHGGKLLRVDSGSYKVISAKVDGFEAKYLQIFGGDIEVLKCYGDAISSKENKGIVAGYTAKFSFGENVVSKFDNIDILETVPEIADIMHISLEDYFGDALLKEGYSEGMTDDQIAALPNVTLNEETTEYETDSTSLYIKGLITRPIVLKTKSTDIYLDKACIKISDFDYAILYSSSSKKLAIRPRVDEEEDDYIDVSYIIYSGNGSAIKSNKNCTLQGDNALIVKSSANLIDASEVVFRCDDGIKILDAENNNTTTTSIFIGGDKDQKEKFNVGSLVTNFVLEAKYNASKSESDDAKVKIINGQVGYITTKAFFGKEVLANVNLDTVEYDSTIILQKDKLDYLLERLYLLENI